LLPPSREKKKMKEKKKNKKKKKNNKKKKNSERSVWIDRRLRESGGPRCGRSRVFYPPLPRRDYLLHYIYALASFRDAGICSCHEYFLFWSLCQGFVRSWKTWESHGIFKRLFLGQE